MLDFAAVTPWRFTLARAVLWQWRKAEGLMVQVTLRLSVAADRAHLLIEALTSHGLRAMRCMGCQSAHVLTDVTEAGAFWYCEEWMDEPALETQLRSDHFSQLLALMEISARPPILEFRTFERARGLDYVAAIRDADE